MVMAKESELKSFADDLVGVLERSKLADSLQARLLIEAAIAIMDRNKLAEGLPFTTRAEFEGFARMMFVALRAKTGNANPPAGGVQA